MASRIAVIVGPTASGKSELAIRVAEHFDGEVVSADSMQVYRGMDIGTAKIPIAERRVPHFGIDIMDPGDPYSAALFQSYARRCFEDISSRGRLPVLAGGTGFYVRAAIDDYDFSSGGQSDNPVRDHYARYASEHGREALWGLLKSRDPRSAEVIHPHNLKRVIRAFELIELDGSSYADRLTELSGIPQLYDALIVYLHVDPEILYERIERRVDLMFDQGLLDEVRGLCDAGFRTACTARDAIGYKECVSYLDGGIRLDEARESIKRATRRYAKRQRAWWRKDARKHLIDATDGDMDRIAEEAVRLFEKEGIGR